MTAPPDNAEAIVPQLYLVTPRLAGPDARFLDRLAASMATGSVSVVLLRGPEEERALRPLAEAVRPLVQEGGAALLTEAPADLRLAARLGFDGVHSSGGELALNEAISAMKPTRIVGVGGLAARHDAMEAGEKDIDYVMFGEPRPDGSLPPLGAVLDRAAWWAEIFTVPCVAFAPDAEAVGPLAMTGADFIALGPFLFDDGVDTPALLKRIAGSLQERCAA